jgi:hypothetical protein
MKSGVPEGVGLVKHDGPPPEVPDKKIQVPHKPAGIKPINEMLMRFAIATAVVLLLACSSTTARDGTIPHNAEDLKKFEEFVS